MPVIRFGEKPKEAIQWVWENWNKICDFVPSPSVLYIPEEEKGKKQPFLRIRTPDGEYKVEYGNWIVKGILGEICIDGGNIK